MGCKGRYGTLVAAIVVISVFCGAKAQTIFSDLTNHVISINEPLCLGQAEVVECWVAYNSSHSIYHGPDYALECLLDDPTLSLTSPHISVLYQQSLYDAFAHRIYLDVFCDESLKVIEEVLSSKTPSLYPRRKRSTMSGCSEVKSNLYGSITSPNYPHEYPEGVNCSWMLRAETGYRLIIQIDYLDVTQCTDRSCCDYVKLVDSEGAEHVLCGNRAVLDPFHPNGANVTVYFVSDEFSEPGANGFSLTYRQEKVRLTATEGTIRSPNYGSLLPLYPNDLHLAWTVEVPTGYHIRVFFVHPFHIEKGSNGCVDRLRRGFGLQVGLLEFLPDLCGRELPPMYYSLTNQIWFELITDSSQRYEGFNLRYSAERRLFNESEGTLTSPLYPNSFPSPIYTEYTIEAPQGYAIDIEVEMFDVPECTEDVNGFCDFCSASASYLEIQSEGPPSAYLYRESGIFPTRRFCNGLPPHRHLLSTDNKVKVIFSSNNGALTGFGFVLSYQFVSNRVELREGYPARVILAPLDYQTLGYIYYEIVVPANHNLLFFDSSLKVDCERQEYVLFTHSLEDVAIGNYQLICGRGDIYRHETLLWIGPQAKLGAVEWKMLVIMSLNYTHTSLRLSLWPSTTLMQSSAGLLYGLGSGNFWASHLDLQKGLPFIIVSVSPPACGPIRYKVYTSPTCESDAEALLRSPYNRPHGEDVRLCGGEGHWVSLDGEFSLFWTPSATNKASNGWLVLTYQMEAQGADCTFDLDLCDWSAEPNSYASLQWLRTSTEVVQLHTVSFLRLYLSHVDRLWGEWTPPFTNYYVHVPMNLGYAGESARLFSTLMSSQVSRTLSFKYHMHGSDIGQLSVYTWSPSTEVLRLAWSQPGVSNISWQQVEGVSVSACSAYYVLFEATVPLGMSSSGSEDIAVDDVAFCQAPGNRKSCDDGECGNGTCIDVSPSSFNGGAHFECCCHTGYTGRACETELHLCSDGTVSCSNGATCLEWQVVGGVVSPAHCSCTPGFTGHLCEVEVDECASNPCANDARCVDGLNGYHCICPAYFTGPDCQFNMNPCEQQPCEHGATCIHFQLHTYRCVCPLGYTGYNCEVEINECSVKPCYNGATCLDLLNNFQCVCPPGFTGTRCELNVDSCIEAVTAGVCHNGASCLNTVNGFICQCVDGWRGKYCEERVNDCLTNPCLNGALCVDRHRGYECVCAFGYHGRHCEHKADLCIDNECVHGFCQQITTGYRCECTAGYTGAHCTNVVDACLTSPCQGIDCITLMHGGYLCVCPVGLTGSTCQYKVDHCEGVDPCLNGGTCVSRDTDYWCECLSGYRGVVCEQRASGCAGSPCIHGKCEESSSGYICRCEQGWTGDVCDSVDQSRSCGVANPCLRGSTCIDVLNGVVCACLAGYTGSQCSVNVDECHSSPCFNGATCIDAVNSFTCDCAPDYHGEYCERKRDECDLITCVQGVCNLENGSPTCECFDGYDGESCDEMIDFCASNLCHSSSSCINLVDGYLCLCDHLQPRGGLHCDEPVDVCQPNLCLNGGTCISEGFTYRCLCPPQTTGPDCHTLKPCDTNPCKHGSCTNVGRVGHECQCDPGWGMPNCDYIINVCTGFPCSHGGRCHIAVGGIPVCECRGMYTGAQCQEERELCDVSCVRGSCQLGTKGVLTGIPYCQCEDGFAGEFCEIDMTRGKVLGAKPLKRQALEKTMNRSDEVRSCHPLGNDRSDRVKWIIVAVTAGLYLIILATSFVFTIITKRLTPRAAAPHDLHRSNDIRYYTPRRTSDKSFSPILRWERQRDNI